MAVLGRSRCYATERYADDWVLRARADRRGDQQAQQNVTASCWPPRRSTEKDLTYRRALLVKFECEAEGIVDVGELSQAYSSDKFAESFGGHGRGLFDEHLRVLAV